MPCMFSVFISSSIKRLLVLVETRLMTFCITFSVCLLIVVDVKYPNIGFLPFTF